jgi:general stress protein YciG
MADQNERGATTGGEMQAQGNGNGNGRRSNRGFASMDASRQREIASKGGRAAHAKGTAHEWTPDEARVAGRKGGEAVSRDRAHMAAIGREGGGARGRNARAQAQNGGSGVGQSSGGQSSGGRGEESRSASRSGGSR